MLTVTNFIYEKDSRTFVAELSSFGPKGIRLERLFPNSTDFGFSIHNPKTGRSCRYVEDKVVKNIDLTVLYREYLPIDSVGAGTKVIIIND